jgi:hypothetical protein
VFIGTVLCYGTIVASLAEMESMVRIFLPSTSKYFGVELFKSCLQSITFVIEISISSPEALPITNTNLLQGSNFWGTISCMWPFPFALACF